MQRKSSEKDSCEQSYNVLDCIRCVCQDAIVTCKNSNKRGESSKIPAKPKTMLTSRKDPNQALQVHLSGERAKLNLLQFMSARVRVDV